MPRLTFSVPKYRKHRASGQAVVTLNGVDHYLGPYRSKVSRDEYDRLIAEWSKRGRQPAVTPAVGIRIIELTDRYWSHATTKYVRRGKPTAEQFKIKTTFQHLLRYYTRHPVAEFGLEQLEVVRQSMIDQGWSRKHINQQGCVA